MTDTECAWLAGIIDGEGCIHIRTLNVTPTSNNRSVVYALILKVNMCDEATIRFIHKIVGFGHVCAKNNRPQPSHQPGWTWNACSLEALSVLMHVRPYLVTKAAEADVAVQFMNLPPTPKGPFLVPADLLAQRKAFYDTLRHMKKRRGRRRGDPVLLGASMPANADGAVAAANP